MHRLCSLWQTGHESSMSCLKSTAFGMLRTNGQLLTCPPKSGLATMKSLAICSHLRIAQPLRCVGVLQPWYCCSPDVPPSLELDAGTTWQWRVVRGQAADQTKASKKIRGILGGHLAANSVFFISWPSSGFWVLAAGRDGSL